MSLCLVLGGVNGCTAQRTLTGSGGPKPGETRLVSTAAGAVGSAVGQIGKLLGCRTVGIAGGPDKVRLCLDRFGYGAAIDYKAGDLRAALGRACPEDIDIFFDNHPGAASDAARESGGAGGGGRWCR